MLARRSFRATLVVLALGLLVAAAAFAAKPLGIPTYKQCTTKTKCSANANSNPNGSALSLNFNNTKCPEFTVLNSGSFGSANPNKKTGKFSIKKDLNGYSPADQMQYVVHLALSGTVRFKRSIVGSYTAKTDAPDCKASAQKPVKFSLKFAGLVYGG